MLSPVNSNDQDIFHFDEIEDHIIEEFTTEFHEAHDEIEDILLKLEHQPNNTELLNNIFRYVHTVKGNLQMIGLDPISEFVHSLESVLDKIRKNVLKFDRQLSDVILLSMDLTREMCDLVFGRKPLDISTARAVQQELRQIAESPQEKMAQHANQILRILDPNIVEDDTVEHKQDLEFFIHMAVTMESRSPYWEGRTNRILQFARDMNELSGFAVNQEQLDAAVYLHDTGMAFLPLDILHKSSKLTDAEFAKIKIHPQLGAELLGRIPGWEDAQQIVLQHHEREDGKGYPKSLRGKNICDGAKILAIADTFEAMTQERANREYKRPLLRAISEINSCSDSQFSATWVDIFNQVIRNKKIKRSS